MIGWAVAERRLPGEAESGDGYAVLPFAGGTLFAVVDGLGHGPEAAEATARALAVLGEAPGPDLVAAMEACHATLGSTRGAVISLVSVADRQPELAWLGVGDVAVTVVRGSFAARAHETLLLRPGIVGHTLPRLVAERVPLFPGDALVMCTDGIRSRYVEALDEVDSPQETADRLLADYARGYDDALVLVACYPGQNG